MVNKNRFKIKIFVMFFLLSGAAFASDTNQKNIIQKNEAISDNKNIDIKNISSKSIGNKNTDSKSIGENTNDKNTDSITNQKDLKKDSQVSNSNNINTKLVISNNSAENEAQNDKEKYLKLIEKKDKEVIAAIKNNIAKNIKQSQPETNNSQNTRRSEINNVKEKLFSDNEQINIVLSNRDINRVLVKGDKIQSVNGPAGLFSAKNDMSGSAYISTYGDSTFTIFISTADGHNVSLLVSPRETSGRTVILKPSSLLAPSFEESESYQKTLIALISAMINNEESSDYSYSSYSKKSKKIDFYGVADIKQIASRSGVNLTGITSEIYNKSKKPITIKPSYFYGPGVRAVSLSSQTIAPSETGLLYQVIGGAEHE